MIIHPNSVLPETPWLQEHEVVPQAIVARDMDDFHRRCDSWSGDCECPPCAAAYNNDPVRSARRSRYGQRHRRVRRILQEQKHEK